MPTLLDMQLGPVTITVQYFDELLAGPQNPNGRLPKDIGAHALWYYFGLASRAMDVAKKCMVEEKDLSPIFDETKARRILQTVANLYGIKPERMTRYWEAVDAQRAALGYSENADLPAKFRFRFN